LKHVTWIELAQDRVSALTMLNVWVLMRKS